MLFTMQREESRNDATLSKLWVGNVFVCDVLEDVVREVEGEPVSTWKVPGKTAIPAGIYYITLEDSQRFGPDTLTVNQVPGFQYIRIHGGNRSEDTEGCLLPGTRNSTNTVGSSQVALHALRALVVPAIQAGDSVFIEILNPLKSA
jgi:hypothetical protein